MQALAITWPAIVKIGDDAELIFISGQADWEQNAAHHNFHYRDNDMLIDSAGKLYSLTTRENDHVVPLPANQTLTLDDIVLLVRAHAALTGACCISKIAASSIGNAIKLVEFIDA